MSATLSKTALGESAMVLLGEQLGRACLVSPQATIYLQGDLGRGKTTLSRGVLKAYGHEGAVKSPTYTLVEPYQFDGATVYHFDLYRLGDPEELEYMGIRDYFSENSLCLVEWAEKGAPFLPAADLIISIEPVNDGRVVALAGVSPRGEMILDNMP